mgnify:CR=1 FL=1
MLACSVSLAACWMVVVQWGYCISSSEGGLGGLSSQLLLKRSVCSVVAQQAFKAAVRSRAACCVPCG